MRVSRQPLRPRELTPLVTPQRKPSESHLLSFPGEWMKGNMASPLAGRPSPSTDHFREPGRLARGESPHRDTSKRVTPYEMPGANPPGTSSLA